MAIQKKSLISALKTAKKANIASAKPAGEDVVPEVANAKNLKSMRQMKSLRQMRSAKVNLRSARSFKKA